MYELSVILLYKYNKTTQYLKQFLWRLAILSLAIDEYPLGVWFFLYVSLNVQKIYKEILNMHLTCNTHYLSCNWNRSRKWTTHRQIWNNIKEAKGPKWDESKINHDFIDWSPSKKGTLRNMEFILYNIFNEVLSITSIILYFIFASC